MRSLQAAIIQQACDHNHAVWILLKDRPLHSAAEELLLIRGKHWHTRLVAVIPLNSLVLHSPTCWSDAKWDEAPSNYATQIWTLQRSYHPSRSDVRTKVIAESEANLPLKIQHKLGELNSRRYDLYSLSDGPPRPLLCYREKQQDARQNLHDGPLAATDGSLSLWKEHMGTSFVLVKKPGSAVSLQFSAPVGGPLATLRAEAVGLLYLLWRVELHFERVIPLLFKASARSAQRWRRGPAVLERGAPRARVTSQVLPFHWPVP